MIGLRPENPITWVMRMILVFEALIVGLAIPGMIQVSGLPPAVALGLGGVGIALCLVAAGSLKRPFGYPLAWLAQLLLVGLGFATDMMFVVGGMFAFTWAVAFVFGRRLQRPPA